MPEPQPRPTEHAEHHSYCPAGWNTNRLCTCRAGPQHAPSPAPDQMTALERQLTDQLAQACAGWSRELDESVRREAHYRAQLAHAQAERDQNAEYAQDLGKQVLDLRIEVEAKRTVGRPPSEARKEVARLNREIAAFDRTAAVPDQGEPVG